MKESNRERHLHPLAYFLNASNSRGWAARNSICVPHTCGRNPRNQQSSTMSLRMLAGDRVANRGRSDPGTPIRECQVADLLGSQCPPPYTDFWFVSILPLCIYSLSLYIIFYRYLLSSSTEIHEPQDTFKLLLRIFLVMQIQGTKSTRQYKKF